MSFDERLRDAIERGQQRRAKQELAERERALSEEELKRLHSQYRLRLSEEIEHRLKELLNYFPGFQTETIYGDRGWGGACFRDDFKPGARGRQESNYSRLEMTIRPLSSYHVLDLAAKGTISNKEVFSRNYFEKTAEADTAKFIELINAWILDYAELYAASR